VMTSSSTSCTSSDVTGPVIGNTVCGWVLARTESVSQGIPAGIIVGRQYDPLSAGTTKAALVADSVSTGANLGHTWTMDQSSVTAAGAIDTFLLLLIGIGPKLALVPFVELTASFDQATKTKVLRKMLTTAATVAILLMVLGEVLRALLHFTIGSLSIAGGLILLVLAVWMVLGPPSSSGHDTEGKDPMQLAVFPLAVPYLLNPVGIVALMTISAEAKSFSVFAVEFGILIVVLLLDVVVFRWANRVSAKLDENRMLVTEKVFGFLIAAVAVQLVLDGLVSVGVISSVPH
jgi:small neutral amino acid transporter SnatA (MarC family)